MMSPATGEAPPARPTRRTRVLSGLVIAVAVVEIMSFWGSGIASGMSHSSAVVPPGAAPSVATAPTVAPQIVAAQESLTSSGGTGVAKVTPPGGEGALMAYDAKDHYVILTGGSAGNHTWKFAGGVWSELSTGSSAPPGGYASSMAYDAKDGYVVLVVLGETWTFSGGVWTELHPTLAPKKLFAGAMSYDSTDGYLVLFGGVNVTGVYLNDTWKFSGGHWTKIAGKTHPSARAFASMVDDAVDGYVVLFGGCHTQPACTTGYFLSDTWKFVGGTWALLTPTSHPSARAGVMLAYDGHDGYVLLFGGCNSSNCSAPFSDTWKFVGGAWTHLTPTVHPPARVLGAGTYDAKTGYVVLFGGSGTSFTGLNDTWKFLTGSWTKI
jgi:hypothetical protein